MPQVRCQQNLTFRGS